MYIRKCYPWKLGCVDFSKPMIGTMIPTTSSIGSIKWRMIVTIIYYHRFVNLLKVKLSFPIYRPPGVHLNYEDQARYGNRFKCNTYGMTWIWISPETSRCYIISWRTSLVRVSPLFLASDGTICKYHFTQNFMKCRELTHSPIQPGSLEGNPRWQADASRRRWRAQGDVAGFPKRRWDGHQAFSLVETCENTCWWSIDYLCNG